MADPDASGTPEEQLDRPATGPTVSPPSVASDFHTKFLTQFGADATVGPVASEKAAADRGGHGETLDAAEAADTAALSEGQRYRLHGEIARGGMGAILKVWDNHLRRTLAMKVILGSEGNPGNDGTPVTRHMLDRFLEEAQITGQLDHPGVVPVHELGIDDDGQVYFTMRLVRGRDFGTVIEHSRAERDDWNRARALGTLLKVCETMAYAHSKRVVHRDLKPANIMVGRFGETYVMDWGLARLMSANEHMGTHGSTSVIEVVYSGGGKKGDPLSSSMTQEGAVMGTPCYMSPEQAAGRVEEVGPASDVYSAGCMLYQLLTGQRPYQGETSQTASEVIAAVLAGPPAPVRSLDRTVPPELIAIADKAMARDSWDRYPNMSGMAEDVRAFLERRVVKAYETGGLAELRKCMARNKGMVAAIASLITLAMASLTVFALLQASSFNEVQAAHVETNSALATARQKGYVANVVAADLSLRARQVAEAKRYLLACEPEQRGWEWRHLWFKADTAAWVADEHDAAVVAVAFDPRNRRLATGDARGIVRVWDVAGRRCSHVLGAAAGEQQEPDDGVVELAFTGDGERLVAFRSDVRVWDPASGALVESFAMTDWSGSALAVSPDGTRVAYASTADDLKVISTLTGTSFAHVQGLEGGAEAIAYSRSDKWVVTAGQDGTLRLWDVAAGVVSRTFAAPGSAVRALAFHPRDHGVFACGLEDGRVLGWSVEQSEPVVTFGAHDAAVNSIAYSSGGQRLASASFDKTVRVWDAATLEPLATLVGHEENIRAITFGRSAAVLVSGSNDNTVRMWDLDDVEAISTWRGPGEMSAVAVGPGGTRVITASSYPARVEIRTIGAAVPDLAVDLDAEDTIRAVAFSGDGRRMAAALEEAACIKLWDPPRQEPVTLAQQDASPVTSVAFAAGAGQIISGSEDHIVRVWDVAMRRVIHELEGHRDRVRAVAVTRDGAYLASGSLDGVVRLWDVDTWQLVHEWDGHTGGAHALAFTQDGDKLAIGCGDNVLRLRAIPTGDLCGELRGHENAIRAVACSNDGARLVTGSLDKTLRVWHTETGRSLLTLRGHELPVTAVAFAGETAILSTSFDGTTRVWRAKAAN